MTSSESEEEVKRKYGGNLGFMGVKLVIGGKKWQEQITAAAPKISAEATHVIIHDAARPFVSSALIERAIAAANEHGAAVPAITVADTVKKVDARGTITATIDRNELRIVQTPQAFSYGLIVDAHARAVAHGHRTRISSCPPVGGGR